MIAVIGPECSGTKWVTELVRRHPDAGPVQHASFPSNPWPDSVWPNIEDADKVLVVVRYWEIARKSQERRGYLNNRPDAFTDSESIAKIILSAAKLKPHWWVSYDVLIGPFGREYWYRILNDIELNTSLYPWATFDPVDANRPYLSGEPLAKDAPK